MIEAAAVGANTTQFIAENRPSGAGLKHPPTGSGSGISLPDDKSIAHCVRQGDSAPLSAGLYPLPVRDPKTVQPVLVGNFPEKSDVAGAARPQEVPLWLEHRLQHQLSEAAAALADRAAIDGTASVASNDDVQKCVDDFIALSAHLSQAKFTGSDDLSNAMLFKEGMALASSVHVLQNNKMPVDLDLKFDAALAALAALTSIVVDGDLARASLEAALEELSGLLLAMQNSAGAIDPEKMLALEAALARINPMFLKGNAGLSLTQAYMEVQRLNAWGLAQAALQNCAPHCDAAQEVVVADRLAAAMMVEAAIASATTTVLQAEQDGLVEIDPPAKMEFEGNLCRFSHVAHQFHAVSQGGPDEPESMSGVRFHSPTPAAAAEGKPAAAEQLDQWCKHSDIGGEVLRLFMTALISMREGMRESRQLALVLYSQHAEAAIAALEKQAAENFTKELLTAIGTIVSGVVQMVPAVYALGKFGIKHMRAHSSKGRTLVVETANPSAQAVTPEPSSPSGSRRGTRADGARESLSEPGISHTRTEVNKTHVDVDLVIEHPSANNRAGRRETARHDAASQERAVKDAKATKSKETEKSTQSKETEESTQEVRKNLNDNHNKAMKLQNVMLGFRALGETMQGVFGIVSAFHGRSAGLAGAEHFSRNAEMQKQIFQRDKWNAEGEMVTRSMDQVATIISEAQTRQSDSLSKLTGRV